ncbi:MAG: hypothetical protein PWP51_521 [Clostridiales bacterium]|jgi:hypothetical protein|nr:hypothetical protein [Clostridiales bacterium]MDN5297968.1 hypothetical protein [Clostridiales bacterium]
MRLKPNYIALMLVIVLAVAVPLYRHIETHPLGYTAPLAGNDAFDLEAYIVSENMPNTSIYSYRVDQKFHSIDDIIVYLRAYEDTDGRHFNKRLYDLGSYKDQDGDVDWEAVKEAVTVTHRYWNRVYTITYRASFPESNQCHIDITADGYILDYRSAGF